MPRHGSTDQPDEQRVPAVVGGQPVTRRQRREAERQLLATAAALSAANAPADRPADDAAARTTASHTTDSPATASPATTSLAVTAEFPLPAGTEEKTEPAAEPQQKREQEPGRRAAGAAAREGVPTGGAVTGSRRSDSSATAVAAATAAAATAAATAAAVVQRARRYLPRQLPGRPAVRGVRGLGDRISDLAGDRSGGRSGERSGGRTWGGTARLPRSGSTVVPERQLQTRSGGTACRRTQNRRLALHAAGGLAVLLGMAVAAVPVVVALLIVAVMTSADNGVLGAVLAGIAVTIAAVAVRTMHEITTTESRPLVGAELPAHAHPQLWKAIADLGGLIGAPVPERIVVDGAAAVAINTAEAQREMLIGLPLLIGLDRDELRAVIAHELAHDAPDRPTLVTVAYKVARRMNRSISALDAGLTRWLLVRAARPYLALVAPVLRDHELAADDWAARVCGPGVTASGLQRAAKLRTAWTILTEQYLPLSGPARRRPSLADGLRNLLAARAMELDAAPPPPPASRFDAHPPAPERVGRLSALPPGAARARRAPAVTLLAGEEATIPDLERHVLVDDDPPAGWAEIAELAGQAEQERVAAVVARAALAAGVPEPVTLDGLLDALARGAGPAIVDPLLAPGLSPAQRPVVAVRLARDCLAAVVGVAMLRSGLARFRLDWTGPSRLERRGVGGGWAAWDGAELITEAATSPTGVAPLRTWLAHLGVDLTSPIDPAPEPPPRPLSAFADAELNGPFGPRPVDLLVFTTGVLLVPAPTITAWRRVGRWLTRRTERAATDRIVRLAERAGTAPEEVDGGWWIPDDAISHAQLRERRIGFELLLRLQDGSGAVVTATENTTRRGTPDDDLTRLFGDRLSSIG
jgi:Zn-dependent protease with chaperone function